MPDQKVSDEVGFENFIRMSWGDLEELVEVVVTCHSSVSITMTRHNLSADTTEHLNMSRWSSSPDFLVTSSRDGQKLATSP